MSLRIVRNVIATINKNHHRLIVIFIEKHQEISSYVECIVEKILEREQFSVPRLTS